MSGTSLYYAVYGGMVRKMNIFFRATFTRSVFLTFNGLNVKQTIVSFFA